MLRSCQYCGRIHDAGYICPDKAARMKAQQQKRRRDKQATNFRKSTRWTEMSKLIRERDNNMCLCCAEKMGDHADKHLMDLATRNLQVHHITPLVEDFEQRIDEHNLITLCPYHHEQCEKQEISRDIQRYLVTKSIERRENIAAPTA